MKLEDVLNSLPSREDIVSALTSNKQAPATGIDVPTVLGVFGVGVFLGAGLALLFAPKPGQELRHDIAERFDDVRHKFDNGNETSSRSLADAPTA